MTDSLVWTPLVVPEPTGDLLGSFFSGVQNRASDSIGSSFRLRDTDHRGGHTPTPIPDSSAASARPKHSQLKHSAADSAVSLLPKNVGVDASHGDGCETSAAEFKGKVPAGVSGSPCMAEDDPNQNDPAYDLTATTAASSAPRWGPQHAGAQELASQYTYG